MDFWGVLIVWFYLTAVDRDHCLTLLPFHRWEFWEPNPGGAAWVEGKAGEAAPGHLLGN